MSQQSDSPIKDISSEKIEKPIGDIVLDTTPKVAPNVAVAEEEKKEEEKEEDDSSILTKI